MRKILGVATLLGIALVTYLRPFQPTQAASGTSVSATYQQGTIRVTIPYRAPRAGAGRLTVEVVDPEDRVVSRADHTVGANGGSGWWREELKLGTPVSAEDLVWHRLRYRFQYSEGKDAPIAGTESISQILARPLIHILGQQSYFAGGAAAVRVIATDTHNDSVGDGMLRIELKVPNQKPRTLFTGRMNQRGTAEAQFRFPAGLVGSFPLRYAVETAIGPAEFTQQVRLEEKASVLLTTEKPIYQPGQTIHVRALALDPADHEAAAGRNLTFEVQDSRGNKVFKKATQTDAFGIASAEFALADEVNLGAWHLRAMTGEGASAAEMTIQVDRYVLPKFKVAVELDGSQARSHGYRPGDHVKGTVRANYFFGKPVEGEVTLKGSAMDVAMLQVAELSGKTDGDGAWHFDLKLPDYFAGRPLTQGAAQVLLEASVKDSAGHTETHGSPITVSQSPLIITAVPEGGSLAPGIENQVFVLTSYADGKPAATEVRVTAGGMDQKSSTDAGGVAVVTVMPQAGKMWQIEAADHEGNHATAKVNLEVRAAGDQVLLRSERAVYRAGERIALKVFSTKQRGAAYVDVVRQGQTMLTRDVELVNGQAELSLTATPDLAGTVDFNAYIFGEAAQPVSDHRLVFVQPADELKVEATADAAVYKPGEDARIRFRVTNSRGEGVRAALGVQVVDEAVFALAEKQPGFAKIFFYLEQEVMKPRYEIHSIGMPEAIETGNAVRHERAARALFAATELVNGNRFETEVGRPLPMARYTEYAVRYRTAMMAQLKKVADDTGKREFRSAAAKMRDSWGTSLRVDNWGGGYVVRSAGPDKQHDTWDDLLLRVEDGGNRAVLRDDIGFGEGGGIGRGMGGGGGVREMAMARMEMAPGMAGAGRNFAAPMAAPMAAMDARASTGTLKKSEVEKDKSDDSGGARVRSYFPEALYINPEIITDQHGMATISIPLADSITTWRMAMMASTAKGALGSGTSSLKVFQDFFVDLDVPVTVTQGDRVTIPVAAYNYSPARGDIQLELQAGDWYRLVEDGANKSVTVEPGRVGGSQFTLEAARIGKFKLTLSARMTGAAKRADIVVREIEVVPNGREQSVVFNGRLQASGEPTALAAHAVSFPANSIAEAGKVMVRLYPGPLSQVMEGMDAILQMPGGCFEQTSSSTYPNVLALDYMKTTGKLSPEVHAKAEGYIANGYQRLVTFEVPGGGFSWFGQAPANKILTAYGLMEFSDMSKVHDVDANVIARTQQWLVSQQRGDGSWQPDTNFINEGATNRYNSDVVRITAYIGWSLENTGFQGPAVEKARQYVQQHMGERADSYTLAVVANFAAESQDREFTRRAIAALLDAREEKNEQAWWNAEETAVYATGASASVETTGLAVQALLKAGEASATAGKALAYLASKKDASGTWGTTQATIMALRALLLSTSKGAADVRGTVEISLNGRPAERLVLTPENNDLFHQFVLKGVDSEGANQVEIRYDGKGSLAYQVVGRYFVPWEVRPAAEALSIDVQYDRTRLAQDDIAEATARVRNNMPKSANMVMVDLGIAPGFELLTEDLAEFQARTQAQKSGRLEKFSLTGTQAILYFDSIGPNQTVTVRFRLRAKYPVRAKTFASRVYEYYDPAVNSVARPVQLEVSKK